jgi:hypothetical protein
MSTLANFLPRYPLTPRATPATTESKKKKLNVLFGKEYYYTDSSWSESEESEVSKESW